MGSSGFASSAIERADEKVKYQTAYDDLMKIISRKISNISQKEKIGLAVFRSSSRRHLLPKIRKNIFVKSVNEHGISLAETARQLGLSTSAIANDFNADLLRCFILNDVGKFIIKTEKKMN